MRRSNGWAQRLRPGSRAAGSNRFSDLMPPLHRASLVGPLGLRCSAGRHRIRAPAQAMAAGATTAAVASFAHCCGAESRSSWPAQNLWARRVQQQPHKSASGSVRVAGRLAELGREAIGGHEFGGHQAHGVTELCKLACPVVSTQAGLHADQARR